MMVVARTVSAPRGEPQRLARRLYVEVADIQRVVFDEFAAWLDLIPHQRREHLIGFGMVLGPDFEQRPYVRIHRRAPQRVGVHLAEALIAVDRDSLLARDDEVFDE